MKIAILYSGSIRTLAETINNNLSCFDFANIDLYFSIWDHVGYSDRINSPDYIFSNRLLNKDILITEELIKSIVPKNVNIKIIKIEKYNQDNYKLDLINGIDNQGLCAQYYKILDCFNLLDQNENYDLIIRLRCDILFNNKINKEFLLECVSANNIIFTSKIWYDHLWNTGCSDINEMLWISSKELMKKACNIYNNCNRINSIISSKNKTTKNYGENICFMNLVAEKISNKIKIFDFDYNILR